MNSEDKNVIQINNTSDNKIDYNAYVINSEADHDNLTESNNISQQDLDNLVYESKTNDNLGKLNEYLNLNQGNIYETILNKLQTNQEMIIYNDTDRGNLDIEALPTESNEEETDLEKFYENRQLQFEEALIRKTSTNKPANKIKNGMNSTNTITNKLMNSYTSVSQSKASENKEVKHSKNNYRQKPESKENKKPSPDKLTQNVSIEGIKSLASTNVFSKDNKSSNNNLSLITQTQMPKRNTKNYEDYKTSTKINNTLNKSTSNNNRNRNPSITFSIRNASQKKVERNSPKTIRRTYSDRLLLLNKSKNDKIKSSLNNDKDIMRKVNLKVIEDSIEEIIDFHKIGNISVSLIKTANKENKENDTGSSYKGIYTRKKSLKNSTANINEKPSLLTQNSSEAIVNQFINSVRVENQKGKEEDKENNLNTNKSIDTDVHNNPNNSINPFLSKNDPLGILPKNETNQKEKPYLFGKTEKIKGKDENILITSSVLNNSSTNYTNSFKNHTKFNHDKVTGNKKSNKNTNLKFKPSIEKSPTIIKLNRNEPLENSSICNKEKSEENVKPELMNITGNKIPTDKNENPEQVKISTSKQSIKLNLKDLDSDNNSEIYVKPKLTNRLSRTYSSDKFNMNKFNKTNAFTDFYQKNLNWKKEVEDEVKFNLEQKKIYEMKNCSFTPKLNISQNLSVKNYNPEEFYKRNLTWKNKIEKFKQDEVVEKERKEFSECIFRPNSRRKLKDDKNLKIKDDSLFKRNMEWLNKINENKKMKQLDYEEVMKEKARAVQMQIKKGIDRSQSKNRSRSRSNLFIINNVNSSQPTRLIGNKVDYSMQIDPEYRLDTEGQKLKEDLSTINFRSNYLSSNSNRTNNLSALYKEFERSNLEKDMNELKNLVVSLKATLDENRKINQEEKEERKAQENSRKNYHDDMNINVNHSYIITVNDIKCPREGLENTKRSKRNNSVEKVRRVNNYNTL